MNDTERAKQLKSQILDLVGEYFKIVHAPKEFIPGQSPVPVSGKVFGAEEVQMLVESSLDFWLTTGRFNAEFEKRLREFLGVRFALTCNSGSSANLIAMSALNSPMVDNHLKPGDEVITCSTGFPTTVNPIIQNNLVPVFVDVDIPTYNIKADLIEQAITPKTRAIMVAHALGNPFDLDTVMAIAKKYNLFVIEDSCDALGATYNGQLVGTFGDIGTVSFYPAHHITMGEGGAVWTKNGIIKRAIESIRDWGRDCYCDPGVDNTCKRRFEWKLGDLPKGYDHKYTYSNIGYNLKITDMQAAVGLAQIDRLDYFIKKRRQNFDILQSGFKEFEEFFILPKATDKSVPSWFGFPLTVRNTNRFSRDNLIAFLESKKISTRLLFGGNLLKQPYMKGRNYICQDATPNSDIVMTSTFWIGLYPGLNSNHLNYIIENVRDYCLGLKSP
jgi:CDP-6-deoxy-D-xylo-4-hexulose-3-dehydrase